MALNGTNVCLLVNSFFFRFLKGLLMTMRLIASVLLSVFTFGTLANVWVLQCSPWQSDCAFAFQVDAPDQEPSFYSPIVKVVEGWTVEFDPQLLEDHNAQFTEDATKALANHLQRIKYIVAKEKVQQLQTISIRIELKNTKLSSMQYHPSAGWLRANGHDPKLAKRVHIPDASALLSRQMWAKHPYVVLHELAHAYHDQILGFENEEIQAVFARAAASGSYQKVRAHNGQQVLHYGMNNAKEYFAESTEAYFGVNDFYPFVRAELREHDPAMLTLLEKIWGKIEE